MAVHMDLEVGVVRTGYSGSKLAAWVALALTLLLIVSDFVDRQIVISILPILKTVWSLSDTQLGSLVSIVSLTVAVFSIPVALLADRWSRVKSIVLMALLWSLAMVACAFATDYTQLLSLRGLIGLGEPSTVRCRMVRSIRHWVHDVVCLGRGSDQMIYHHLAAKANGRNNLTRS